MRNFTFSKSKNHEGHDRLRSRQWRGNRGYRQFNELGNPKSWGPSGAASYRQGRAYRHYRFRSGPTSGRTTRPQEAKKVKLKSTVKFSICFNHIAFICYRMRERPTEQRPPLPYARSWWGGARCMAPLPQTYPRSHSGLAH